MKYIIPQIDNSEKKFKIELALIFEMPLTLQVRLLEILINNKDFNFSKHNYKMIGQFINKPKMEEYLTFLILELRHERKFLVGYKKEKSSNNSLSI